VGGIDGTMKIRDDSRCFLYVYPYHHSGGDSNTSTAVCVGYDVAETDTQERDGDEPHGVEEIRVFLVVESATK